MNQDSFSFVVYIIHACANKWRSTPSEVYQRLKDSGCIDNLLVRDYDVLHTQSSSYVVSDVEDFLKARGVFS